MDITQSELQAGIRELFVSYWFVSLEDTKISGPGNLVTKFAPEQYQNNLSKFITELEKTISVALSLQYKKKIEVKVLFFR